MVLVMSQPLRCLIPSPILDDDLDSEAYSVASLPPFSPTPSEAASSATSHDLSMRSVSPSPSVWSLTSSLQRHIFRQEYGRGLNNYSDIYRLPADKEELDRLDKQHVMFKEVMGLYPPPMEEVMAQEFPGETKACLDLGCGSGSWIMDIAHAFPHCNAVAVDLIPMQSPSMPPNCRSEVDDINLGLEHFYGDFDVVHARLIASGIRDYASLIDHISRVLRPGGLIHLLEFDFHMYDANKNRVEVGTHQVGPPWWSRWLAFAKLAVINSGGSPDAATHLHSWIREHPAFEDVVYQDYWVPTSPWINGSDAQKRVAACMRDDIIAFLKSGRPLLLGNGLPEELVDELELNATAELMAAQYPHYVRLQDVYARKRRQ
ncbi:S-adenosyl-L-methionine-dependent methyltransferase [Pluteus cervinus]|uniref:S-adenosyl-L-methionine-dependent methyltransferase n=1 Tax=Pluteus cervinus TaxID=181527 RepID=A0ACD3BHA8_9AGAR|nr:S-adenosyl-L-methionine-dependent methyltransferase [Pluteus cervinus]